MKWILAILIVAVPPPAVAQTADARQTLIPLMSMDCGVGETAERFRTVLAESGSGAGPVLLELLADGAPTTIREQARTDAAERYARLAEWAQQNPDRPHARAFADVTREAYISEKLDHLDLTYRSNALQGLAITRPPNVASAIRQAYERDPRLRELGAQALRAIGEQ